MATKIIFGDYVFEDAADDLMKVSGATYQSLLSTVLSADEFTFIARYNPALLGYYIVDEDEGSDYLRDNSGAIICVTSSNTSITDFENFTYAAPVSIYEDNTLIYRFYVTNIAPLAKEQDGTIEFEFTCLSFVGLMINQEHKGGMYTNSTFGAVVADILDATLTSTGSEVKTYTCSNGLTYTVDLAVDSSRIDGHLPIASARDNIRDVLEQCGASILKNADGTVRFTYNIADTPVGIAAEDIYMGDKYADSERVTAVKVVEHNFYTLSGTSLETIYDGSGEVLDHSIVLFDEPMYDMAQSPDVLSGDLVINASNCNYADISGTGVLQGKPYTHAQRQLTQTTGLTSTENIRQIDENELVSPLNSSNLLERLRNYYKNAREVDASFVAGTSIKTGSLVSFSDPLSRTKTGYVTEMQFNVTGIIKAVSKIITNWSPSGLGPNYTTSETLSGSGTYTVPSGTTKIRLVLIQGGTGGTGGAKGGEQSTTSGTEQSDGGAVGSGGSCGKVYQADITVTPGQTFSYSVGAGGAGGAINSGAGSEGGHSTFGSYSSADGSRPSSGFINIITGALYALVGPDGYVPGGKGGGHDYMLGEDVTYGGQTWSGGDRGSDITGTNYISYGGAGGGAAYGANGGDGTRGTSGVWTGGDGGDGADAVFNASFFTPAYGGGGLGGNGGGGSGSCGAVSEASGSGLHASGSHGTGGNGSVGGAGGSGVIFVIH